MSRQMRNDKVIGGSSNNASAILYQPAESGRSETNVKAELDKINSDLSKNNTSGSTSLNMGETYTFTSDGYIKIANDYAYLGYVEIYSANDNLIGSLCPLSPFTGNVAYASCFVKKGMKIKVGLKQFTSCSYSLLV